MVQRIPSKSLVLILLAAVVGTWVVAALPQFPYAPPSGMSWNDDDGPSDPREPEFLPAAPPLPLSFEVLLTPMDPTPRSLRQISLGTLFKNPILLRGPPPSLLITG